MTALRRIAFVAVGVIVAGLTGTPSALSTDISAQAQSSATRPRLMTVRDTQNFVSVGSPAISPDDQWVLHTRTVRDWDDAQWRTKTHLWRVKIDGTGARQLTFGEANTTAPEWFPAGDKIAFLSSRGAAPATADSDGGGSQVFFMHVDGGEAWAATKHAGGVSAFSISPDGKTLLLTAQDPLSSEDRRRSEEHTSELQ